MANDYNINYINLLKEAKRYVKDFIQSKSIEDIKTYKQQTNQPTPNHIKNIKSEIVKDTVKTMLPDLLETLIDRNSAIIKFETDDITFEEKQAIREKAKKFLDKHMFNSTEYVISNYKALKSALILNYGIVKTWLETRVESEQKMVPTEEAQEGDEISDGYAIRTEKYQVPIKPRFKYVDIADFFYIPDADNILASSFIAHRTRIYKGKVKSYGEQGIYDLSGIDVDTLTIDYTDPWETYNRGNQLPYIQASEETKNKNNQKVEVYECYTKEVDEDGNEVSKIITIIGNKVVRVEENTYKTPPFAVYQYDFDIANVEQESISSELKSIQATQTNFIRLMFDNSYRINQLKMRIDPVAFATGQIKLHELNSDKPYFFATKDAIDNNTLSPQPLPPDLFRVIEYLSRMSEKKTGMTTYQQGIPQATARETATGVSTLLSQSQKRLKLIIRLIVETGFNNLLKVLTNMMQMLDILPEYAYLDSENGLGYKDSVLELQKLDRITPLMLQLAQMGVLNQEVLINYLKYLFKAYDLPFEELFAKQQEAMQGQMTPEMLQALLQQQGGMNAGQENINQTNIQKY